MSFIDINQNEQKADIIKNILTKLEEIGFSVTEVADSKPWGAYIRISEDHAQQFRIQFFEGKDYSQDLVQTPKILLVAPGQRLSWQYHFRRKEIWKVLQGPIKVARGASDADQKEFDYYEGDIIELGLEERHRLIGTEEWGIVAEIWYHTDESEPSNEEDIVRVEDDFGRK